MPQKPLKPGSGKKKQVAANRHGKLAKTKKGRLDKAVKRTSLKKKYEEDLQLTKAINAENEYRAAGVAASAGGKLSVLKAPVTATADEKQRAKSKPMKPGLPWGASSK